MSGPAPEEGSDEGHPDQERERPTSSHGASNSVLALNYNSHVQHELNLLKVRNMNAKICSFILNIGIDINDAPEA